MAKGTLNHSLKTALASQTMSVLWMGICALWMSGAPAPAQQGELSTQPELFVPQRPLNISRTHIRGASKKDYNVTCLDPQVSYFGGPVISNVQVVVVFWNSNVNSTAQANLPDYFTGITGSSFYDILSEYSTNIVPTGYSVGTDQSIGRGSFAGAYTITPSVCPASSTADCNVTDAQLQTELAAQIGSGTLPAPEYDFSGNDNTLYMVYFPSNISLAGPEGTGTSCTNPGFCAYHYTGTYGPQSKPLVYGAIMDTFTGACSQVCGFGAFPFENLTSISTHELAESVTDTDVGMVTGDAYAYPAAWGDNNNECGEIADICETGYNFPVWTPTGVYYTQPLWSNAKNACVLSGLNPEYEFTAPTAVDQDTAFSFTLTVLNPAGGKGTDTSFTGTVHFSSSDTNATLPADYTFTPADRGTATFAAGFDAAGAQSITATDMANSAITATAKFTVTDSVKVTIDTSPAGRSFSVDGKTYTAAHTFTWTYRTKHTIAVTALEDGVTGTEYSFTDWSDGGALSHAVEASPSTTSYTATFATYYKISLGVSPAAAGIVDGYYSFFYLPNFFIPAGATVEVVATANTGYKFSKWTGAVANPASSNTTILMSGPETVKADFVDNDVRVTVNTSPADFPVQVDGGVVRTVAETYSWQVGSVHKLVVKLPATIPAGTKYSFVGWTNLTGVSSTDMTYEFTIPPFPLTETASFITSYLLTTAVSPSGAGIVIQSGGASVVPGYYEAGTGVNVSASPNAGYYFSGWTGKVFSASSASTSVLMSAPEKVTAIFAAQRATTTVLGSSANPSTSGELVTFTATVKPSGGGAATGTVTFKSGSITLGSGTLSNNSASLTISTLSVGTDLITAGYSGNTTLKASTSAELKQVIRAR